MKERRVSLVKPKLDTKFFIDFDWWSRYDRDWRVHLVSCLCPEHQKVFKDVNMDELIDWVDPDTAEVQQVDGLQHMLISHCAKEDDFITEHTTLVDAVFRLLLANGNIPMGVTEIAERLGRQPTLLLRTLSGPRVYKGLRPCIE
ncbi:MAG: hypothetical protein AB1345_07365 [Chloroflexota bacterium]